MMFWASIGLLASMVYLLETTFYVICGSGSELLRSDVECPFHATRNSPLDIELFSPCAKLSDLCFVLGPVSLSLCIVIGTVVGYYYSPEQGERMNAAPTIKLTKGSQRLQ